jgi:hypothetical protein
MVILDGTGASLPLGPAVISVVYVYRFFSSGLSIWCLLIYGFSPLLKLFAHTHALTMVIRIRMMVRTAKVVNSLRAGR